MTQQPRAFRLVSRTAKVSILVMLALCAVTVSLSVTDQAAARPNATISEVRLGNLDSLILSRTLQQRRAERPDLAAGYDWMDWHGDDCSPYSASVHAREFEDACAGIRRCQIRCPRWMTVPGPGGISAIAMRLT